MFYSIQYKNGCLAASHLFHMLTQVIKFYTFHYHILREQMFEKVSGKNTPGIKPPVRVSGRVRVRLGIGLGLGSGGFFSGGIFS